MDPVATVFGPRQEENCLLDIGSQHQQIHDLGDAGTADVGKAGELGVVGHDAGADVLVETNGKRHQTGDAGDASGLPLRRGRRLPRMDHFAASSATLPEMDSRFHSD